MAISERVKAERQAISALRKAERRRAYKQAHRESLAAAERARRARRRATLKPIDRTCEWCGAGFSMAGRVKGRDSGRFCSRACGFDYQRTTRALDKAVRDAERQGAAARRALVRREVQALRRIAKYKEKPRVFIHACRQCGEPMRVKRNNGGHAFHCPDCKADNRWATERIGKAKRRARERGAEAESIDPLLLFALYNWHCNGCRKATPRALRGKVHPDAPELDHVIALANGGTHTWSNVQLLCRACNQAKGAS